MFCKLYISVCVLVCNNFPHSFVLVIDVPNSGDIFPKKLSF